MEQVVQRLLEKHMEAQDKIITSLQDTVVKVNILQTRLEEFAADSERIRAMQSEISKLQTKVTIYVAIASVISSSLVGAVILFFFGKL